MRLGPSCPNSTLAEGAEPSFHEHELLACGLCPLCAERLGDTLVQRDGERWPRSLSGGRDVQGGALPRPLGQAREHGLRLVHSAASSKDARTRGLEAALLGVDRHEGVVEHLREAPRRLGQRAHLPPMADVSGMDEPMEVPDELLDGALIHATVLHEYQLDPIVRMGDTYRSQGRLDDARTVYRAVIDAALALYEQIRDEESERARVARALTLAVVGSCRARPPGPPRRRGEVGVCFPH